MEPENELSILAIDDRADNLLVLKAMIKEAFPHAAILTALNGREGIELALAKDPDVILLDIVMPEMDGYEVCRHLKADQYMRDTPVLFLTAIRTSREDRINALETGAEGFLSKPLDEQELVAQIRAMIKIKKANRSKRLEKEELSRLVAGRTRELEEQLAQRRKIEKELKESEKKFRSIFEDALDGIFQSTPEGRVIAANPAAAKMLGYGSPKELTGTVTDIAHQVYADPARRAEIIHSLEKDDKVSGFECEFLRKDGSKIWVRLNVHTSRDSSNRLLHYEGIVEDITERKKAEARLLEQNLIFTTITQIHEEANRCKTLEEFGKSCLNVVESITESKFSLIGEVSPDGLMVDMALSDPGWALCKMRDKTGHRFPGALKIRGLFGYVVREGKSLLTNDLHSHPESIGTPEGHPQLTAFLGVPFLQEGRVVAMIGVGNREGGYTERDREILEALTPTILESLLRKRAEDALRESEERFRVLVQASTQAVWEADAAGLVAKDLPSWRAYTGQTRDEMFGSGWVNAIHPDDREGVERLWWEAVSEEKNVNAEFRLKSPDGDYRWTSVVSSPIRDRNGAVLKWVGMNIDITERKRMEEEIRRSRDELEERVRKRTEELRHANENLRKEMEERTRLEESLRQAHKMEAIGTLAGGIAHDFNNILAAIIGFTEMAIEDVPDRPLVERNLQKVMTSATRARDLVKQILAFSRKTSYERAPIAISPVVEETIKLLRASIPATIDMKFSVSTTSDTVVAARVEVQQIVMNLATNALFAIEDHKGALEITLSDTDFEPDPSALDAASREYLQIMVKDSGVGMTPEVMKRIFEPFFTTREVGKGSGMGLAVVYGTVRDLGGTITVESEPGVGSIFRIFLPKVKAQAEEQTQQGALLRGTERILFVDDELLLVEWGRETLQKLGYTVTAAPDGRQALEIFSADPFLFDLVITDQAMPQMPGSDLCAELLRIRNDIPIILCTGHSETVSPERAEEIGIRGFLIKPLTRQELALAVRRILDGDQG